MPVVEQLAQEFGDQVTFVAPAWKASFDRTLAKAVELMPSNTIQWGLDANEEVFDLFGVTYQPAGLMIVDGVIIDQWPGALGEDDLRERVEYLASFSS